MIGFIKIPEIEFLTLNWIIRSIRINTVCVVKICVKKYTGAKNWWIKFLLTPLAIGESGEIFFLAKITRYTVVLI